MTESKGDECEYITECITGFRIELRLGRGSSVSGKRGGG